MKTLSHEEMKSVTGGCHANLLGCTDDANPEDIVCCAEVTCMGFGVIECGPLDWYLGA